MKNIKIFFCSIAAMICFSQCTSPTSGSFLEQADTRGKTISALMNNDVYMKEVMDSMQAKHGGDMSHMPMGKGAMPMDDAAMNKMMEMCKTDPAMCKMMMNKTMAMCDADSSMCKMMMTSMQMHPNVMKSMQDMRDMKGMKKTDMKDMKMDKKK